ncbi:MAG: PilZ domain-containing protein [Gammaproteobacteria bacterium]|nr:PilZ domain-containing protein [Gammaproteobacteria bacterium]MCW8986954.1 PilZ domain-containing protein [Gammaproteobacteria bacterium]
MVYKLAKKNNKSMADKRKQLRQMVNAPVLLSHSAFGEIKAITGDISNTGVFIRINNKPTLPKGAHIKLQFLSSVYPNVSFNTRVVRVTDEGFGLVFVDYEYGGERFPMNNLKHIWNKEA